MVKKLGRNEPCSCGSGKKYKKCCMGASEKPQDGQHPSPRFRFEPGSYGGPVGYAPSIACLEQVKAGEWSYHFVLAKPQEAYPEEEEASEIAREDLDAGFLEKQHVGNDTALAMFLRERGYLNVTDFNIVKEPNGH